MLRAIPAGLHAVERPFRGAAVDGPVAGTEPMAREMELTGPIALYLQAASSATDIDWVVSVADEAPDGQARELSKGWLRSSHRRIDPAKSTQAKPYHPHAAAEPLGRGCPCAAGAGRRAGHSR